MDIIETFWKLAMASVVVWRLSQALYRADRYGDIYGFGELRPVHGLSSRIQGEHRLDARVLGARTLDFVSWLSVWMSSQTAIWAICGLSGVLLHWFCVAGASRMLLTQQPSMSRGAACSNCEASQ